MDRIIVINCHKVMSAEQLNTLRFRVQEQLPAEGFVVIVIPDGVSLQEIGIAPQYAGLVENYDAESLTQGQTQATPSGKPLEHVNEPIEGDERIRYVWLSAGEITDKQREQAVGEDLVTIPNRWAVELENCEPQQLVGKTVCAI